MLIKRPDDIKSSEITDKELYLNRRQFIRTASLGAAGLGSGLLVPGLLGPMGEARGATKLTGVGKSAFSTDEPQDPAQGHHQLQQLLRVRHRQVGPPEKLQGLQDPPVDRDGGGRGAQAENIRHRGAVEDAAGGAGLPHAMRGGLVHGDPLDRLRAEPPDQGGGTHGNNAKYIQFVTLHDPEQMPGQRRGVLDWPYLEGLRMDEAMNPLAILGVGLYGEVMPNQNGAPVRLVVPWKYGFKSIKSIVKVRFVEKQPATAWNVAGPQEYGFYSNVNPTVNHPRWSQASERRIGDFFRRKTLMFNGYEEQVAHLYKGMDLTKLY